MHVGRNSPLPRRVPPNLGCAVLFSHHISIAGAEYSREKKPRTPMYASSAVLAMADRHAVSTTKTRPSLMPKSNRVGHRSLLDIAGLARAVGGSREKRERSQSVPGVIEGGSCQCHGQL